MLQSWGLRLVNGNMIFLKTAQNMKIWFLINTQYVYAYICMWAHTHTQLSLNLENCQPSYKNGYLKHCFFKVINICQQLPVYERYKQMFITWFSDSCLPEYQTHVYAVEHKMKEKKKHLRRWADEWWVNPWRTEFLRRWFDKWNPQKMSW